MQTDRRLDIYGAFHDAPAGRTVWEPARSGGYLRDAIDRLIGGSSLVSTDPVLDMRAFGWTAMLRENWQAIRDEARGVSQPFCLHGRGHSVAGNLARCPRTAALLEYIPGLDSASFSALAPGAHVPAHRGATKGLVTCHLSLAVPRDGDVRMRVHDRVVRWAEGETLVFDDTYVHEAWNDATDARVILLIQFKRPLRQPGRWIANLFARFVNRAEGAPAGS